jgi:hypothetical protein
MKPGSSLPHSQEPATCPYHLSKIKKTLLVSFKVKWKLTARASRRELVQRVRVWVEAGQTGTKQQRPAVTGAGM